MKKCCSRYLSIPILYLTKMQLNFKNKSYFLNYNFSFELSAITRFCSSRVAWRELDRERK